MTRAQVQKALLIGAFNHEELPQNIPTLDEFPETDTSDLVRKYQQSIEPED